MKPGDKVYCKENSYYQDYFGSYLIHKKGKSYKVTNISDEYYRYVVFIEVEKSTVIEIGDNTHGYCLDINKKLKNPKFVLSRFWHNYNDYFLSQQEYRKLKLKKLYERR